jgi:hypothetical protein
LKQKQILAETSAFEWALGMTVFSSKDIDFPVFSFNNTDFKSHKRLIMSESEVKNFISRQIHKNLILKLIQHLPTTKEIFEALMKILNHESFAQIKRLLIPTSIAETQLSEEQFRFYMTKVIQAINIRQQNCVVPQKYCKQIQRKKICQMTTNMNLLMIRLSFPKS